MNLKLNDWKVWIVRSTFAMDNIDKLPKDFYSFFWHFIFSIIIIHVSFFNHTVNLIFYRKNPKMGSGTGFCVQVINIPIFTPNGS
jgi:hypothetical protein